MKVYVLWGDDLDEFNMGFDVICVIIDVLRASTTMAVMFNKGVSRIIISNSVNEMLDVKRKHVGFLACGERNGIPPDGFDHGNSPVEFLSQNVNLEGKVVVMTTTNFTRIASRVIELGCKAIYSCALVNRAAVTLKVYESAEKNNKNIVLVPAGSKNKAYEDLVGAMMILKKIKEIDAKIDIIPFKNCFKVEDLDRIDDDADKLYSIVLQHSKHANYLSSIGFNVDVRYCLQPDIIEDAIPVYDIKTRSFKNYHS
ncbi:MAG: 2-phosphosulfolactate phosphatase [Promethearchaeota archaeon]